MKKPLLVLLVFQLIATWIYPQMLEQWASKYNGPAGYDDYVTDIAVDALGNVYVTGYVIDSVAGTTDKIDYATVKYNSSGVMERASIYNGPADLMDFANSIGVDADGNVYVTGGSMSSDTTEEWATVKYNAFGVQLWVQRWQGLPGAGHNRAVDMVVDALGNSYVTGFGEPTTYDDIEYVTIKYNTDGVQEWVSLYNHIPEYPSGWDQATAITMDNIGNIYVTGSSFDVTSKGRLDMATIKYNPSGVEQWVSRQAGMTIPIADSEIITDNQGNVFVTGLYTIKYDSDGAQQVLDVPWGFTGTSLAVDLSGNLYVAGTKYGSPSYKTTTIKYNIEGDSLWSRDFNSISSGRPQLAFDNCLGYIYVTSTLYVDNINYIDYLTVRYNSAGDTLWSARYNTHEVSSDQAIAITVDDMANIYITGNSSADPYSSPDYATIKYTPSSFFIHTVSNEDAETEITDNASSSDSIFIDCSLSNYTIATVDVNIEELEHPQVSDLEIYLVHNSTSDNRETLTDTLIYQVGGTGDNFIGTKLGDAATISINEGTAPFTGYFKPQQPLSQFSGLSMEGYWILKIYDRATGNQGVLKSWSVDFALSSQPAGIHDESIEIPQGFILSQNYPNPFNTLTKIEFVVPPGSGGGKQAVSLLVYDARGAEVSNLFSGSQMPGNYELSFDGTNLPGGFYYYKLSAGNFTTSRKMVLLK